MQPMSRIQKKSEELKAAKARRAEILIADARERVGPNPTDLQLRFELGEHFSVPDVSGKPCRSCSGRGKIRTRV